MKGERMKGLEEEVRGEEKGVGREKGERKGKR